jgi:hypothetical protein
MNVYKYYPPESYDFIMKKEGVSVRFSQPSILNDIFEASGSIDIKNQESLLNYSESILDRSDYDGLKKSFPLLPNMFQAIIKDDLFKKHNAADKLLHDTAVGILSLTKNQNSRSMWSYYADSHRGYMLEFEIDLENSYFPFTYSSQSVDYCIERPPSLQEYILKNGRKKNTEEEFNIIFRLWITKDIDWEKEEEYRVIADLTDPYFIDNNEAKIDAYGFPIFTTNVPKKLVKGIYLGANSSEALKRKMAFWITKYSPNTKLYKAKPCETTYKMEYPPIST